MALHLERYGVDKNFEERENLFCTLSIIVDILMFSWKNYKDRESIQEKLIDHTNAKRVATNIGFITRECIRSKNLSS